MNFTIKLVYQDGKDLDIAIDQSALPGFFEALNKHQICWSEDASNGFWTDLEKVRYVQFLSNQESKVIDGKEEGKEGIRELPVQDGRNSSCTDSACAG